VLKKREKKGLLYNKNLESDDAKQAQPVKVHHQRRGGLSGGHKCASCSSSLFMSKNGKFLFNSAIQVLTTASMLPILPTSTWRKMLKLKFCVLTASHVLN